LHEVPSVLREKYGLDIDSEEFANSIYYREIKDFDQSVRGGLKNIDPLAYKK